MSTRGRIAIKENGKYTYIYNHCDSYIDGLGIILYKFYKDVNKVKGLISLGKQELENIINTDGKAEIKCSFCKKKYDFNKEDLENLKEECKK